MWTRGNGDSVLSLRTGVALAGIDPEDLWADCCTASRENIPFESIIAAVLDPGRADNRIWNIVADAIDVRLMAQGFSPLFSPRPVIDLG
jgi:hypothetical protein